MYCKNTDQEGSTPFANTMNPTLTGSSVMAIAYEGGVAVASDRTAFYGKMSRLQNNTRQYQLNKYCLVTFSGDYADFQWLQNFIERKQLELQRGDRKQFLKPKMVHSFLASVFYNRRSKMNPIWATIVISGMQPAEFEAGKFEPFIGVVDMRGVAYEVRHVATDLGSHLLNQMLETRSKQAESKGRQLGKEEAVEVLRDAMRVSIYRNCRSGKCFDIGTVDATNGVQFDEPETVAGDWSMVEVCTGQYF